jgi:hypothetical protein
MINLVAGNVEQWHLNLLSRQIGILEYILIDADGEYVERYFRNAESRFDRGEVFSSAEILLLKSIEQVEIPLWEVFEVRRSNHD